MSFSTAELVVMNSVLRDAAPPLVRALLPIAGRMMASGARPSALADAYRDLSKSKVPMVEWDRAMGAIIRFTRATGHRREARYLAAIVRKSR